MAKAISQTLRATGVPPKVKESKDEGKIHTARPNGGMMTILDPSDIPNENFTAAVNVRTRYDKTMRRNGFTILPNATKPNANPVTKLFYSKLLNGSAIFLRFTSVAGSVTIHRLGINSWIPLASAPSSFSLSSGLGSRISLATVFDKILVADGLRRILYIDGATCTENLTAPVAKFITGFYNRGLAAYTEDSDGAIMTKWTSEYNPGDPTKLENWDFSVSNDAGFERLIDSTSDISDFITGIQGFKDNLIIPRDRSIWTANKQASASKPFRFYCMLPGIGSDCSYCTAMGREGWIFADTRTKAIYVLPSSGAYERISVNVETDLFNTLGVSVDPVDAFAAFDATRNEYHIQFGVHNWIFNFDTKSWQYDESNLVALVTSRISVDKPLVLGLTIDELTGTIDNLVGTIDAQIGTRTDVTNLYIGTSAGEVYFEDATADDDESIAYETLWASKDFSAGDDVDTVIRKLLWGYQTSDPPEVQIEYSTDLGTTWTILRSWYTANATNNGTIVIHKNLTGSVIRWRVKVRSGRFTMLSHGNDIAAGGNTSDDSV